MNEPVETTWRETLDQVVDEQFERIRQVRRHLHRQPEPSGEEFQTSLYLAERLAEFGLEPKLGPEKRGLVVDLGDEEPKLGLRGDIDALRIQDEKQVDYCSHVDGVMHACGHDAHSATIFGAIATLAEMRKRAALPWPVNCRGIFQPAEETNQGALEMMAAGVLKGLHSLLGVHMDPSRMVGTIGVRQGDFTADCHEMKIEVTGRGAHAARPHEAIDPISATAQLISSIYLFVPRGTNSQDPVVVTFGQIEGGYAPNAIPDKVVVRGTLRTLDTQVSEATMRHVDRLLRGVAEASETQITIEWTSGPPPVKNDRDLTRLLIQAGRTTIGSENVKTIPRASMGGEDFANYLTEVRGAMFRLGCARAENAPPLHSSLFDIDEEALRVGTKVLVSAAILWHDPDRNTSD
ncbi:MAG: amidohydrolase [Planctomycetaceae bacterium]|nr:amidohydrolase [Planctomycetaceae bacterium]